MTQLEKALILTELADRLIANGSWCGHTHMQKATYFLQDLLGVPLEVEYILYKHGPYSFDLTEQLMWCQAKYLLEKDYRTPGYGPGLKPTQTSAEHRARHHVTLAKYVREMDFVARTFGSKGVAELEKLATAFYVTRELGEAAEPSRRASRLNELKPHIPTADALAAVQEFDRIAAEAKSLATEATHV